MITEHVLEDEELGRLLVRVNIRARRLTFRTREDAVHVTVPPGTTIGEVKNAVEQLRSRLYGCGTDLFDRSGHLYLSNFG